jgi:hypothetical protein
MAMQVVGRSGRHVFWGQRRALGTNCFGADQLAPWAPGYDRLYAANKAAGGMPGMPWHWQTGMPKNVLLEQYDAQHPEVAFKTTPQPSFFGANSDNTPEQNDLITKNGAVIWGQMSDYPFPTPFTEIQYRWCLLYLMQDDIKTLAKTPEPLNPEVVRYWITAEILKNYEQGSNEAQRVSAWNEKQAKKHARRIKYITIGISAVTAIIAIIVPAVAAAAFAAVQAIQTAIKTYKTVQEQKQMAKDLADTAKAFEEGDAGFAAEVQKLADLSDYEAARQAYSQQLPEEPPAPPPSSSPAVSPLVIGGGIAAAGLAVLAIFHR